VEDFRSVIFENEFVRLKNQIKNIEMSNCKANLETQHFVIDVTNKEAVIESLINSMNFDLDLTENEDEFQEDTLELGYESEADRIVKEYIAENGVPSTIEEYKEAYTEISSNISEQEFFGESALSFIQIDETKLSVMFVCGGEE
jgi:hypothetical protein